MKHPVSPPLQQLLVRAAQHHAAGDLSAAESSYRGALGLDRDQAMALAGMGALEGQKGHSAQAVQYLERACALEPQMAIFQHNHGEALRQLGQLPQAEAALRRAVKLDQGLVPAWDSLIAMAQAAHGQALGVRDSRRADVLATELAHLTNNKGNAWLARGDLAQAIGAYRQALSIRPDYPMAWSNLGHSLGQAGQINQAETVCRHAIALDPDFAAAWNNLGNALIEQGRYQEGAACYAQALAKQPDFPEALHNRGSGSLFNRLFVPLIGDAELTAVHDAWGASYPAPLQPRWNHNPREPDRVLRVAYLSPDFREHAMQHFIEPLLACHRPSNVEVVCYAQGPGADEHTRRLIAYGHHWNWVHRLSDAELSARIRHDRIDILVDCAGHTRGTRLAALAGKPAPILMGWLGYLHATGLPAMDYRLTDAWVDPPGPDRPADNDAAGPEMPLRIPGGMLAYRPHPAAPDVNPLPCLARGGTTFGSLNNIQKLNRYLVADWATLLGAVPQSRLLLQSKHLADPGVVGRVRGMFEAFGIAPARLDLRPASADFLRTYHEIDIALDTLPYGGGATTCDALWMGVPVITQSGSRAAGRLSTSLLHLAGHPEWVTATSHDYIVAAIALARNTRLLAQIRRELRGQLQASALCDEAGFVARLEDLYRAVWKHRLAKA